MTTSGSLTPDEISEGLSINVTHHWCKGQPVVPGASKTFEHNRLELTAQSSGPAASAENLTEQLLQSIDISQLLAFKSKHLELEFELSMIVYLSTSAPAISLSGSQVRALASLHAYIDVDIYPA